MTGPTVYILPDLVHEFETLSCRSTMRIAYTYYPREDDDGRYGPMYPESVEIESVACIAFDILYESGLVFIGFTASMIRPTLNEAFVAMFRVEVQDDRLETMCLEDARSRQEE